MKPFLAIELRLFTFFYFFGLRLGCVLETLGAWLESRARFLTFFVDSCFNLAAPRVPT
jgi:hypothetical protein